MSPIPAYDDLDALAEIDGLSKARARVRSRALLPVLSVDFFQCAAGLVARDFMIHRKDGSFALTSRGARALSAPRNAAFAMGKDHPLPIA
jgi:hypothetical protein